jgi:3D (Asp-Asp-Asp) domain-containing protein
MTAFTPTDLPSAVNSVEKLVAWGGTILNDLYTTTTAIEATGVAERVAQSAPFLVTASDPYVWRLITRTSIPLQPTWRRQGKLWLYANDIGSLAIPTEYKS